MTDKDRIDRLERVVELLISWLHRELGASAAQALLKDLKDVPPTAALASGKPGEAGNG